MAGAGIRALQGQKPMSNKALSAHVAARAAMDGWAKTAGQTSGMMSFLGGKLGTSQGSDARTAAKLTSAPAVRNPVALGADRQMTGKDHTTDFRGGSRGDMDHYADALDRMRNGGGQERRDVMKEINAIRAQRSIAQNRAGLQQNLFGGATSTAKRVPADVWMSAASKKRNADEAAAKDASRAVAARAARKAEIAARPYKAPAENPRTAAAKLSAPSTLHATWKDGTQSSFPSHGSLGGAHLVHAGHGKAGEQYAVYHAKSGYRVANDMSKTDAASFLRGARTGRTLDRKTGGTPDEKRLANMAVKRYQNIVQTRREQAQIAKTGFAGKIQITRSFNGDKVYRADGRHFSSLKAASGHLASVSA